MSGPIFLWYLIVLRLGNGRKGGPLNIAWQDLGTGLHGWLTPVRCHEGDASYLAQTWCSAWVPPSEHQYPLLRLACPLSAASRKGISWVPHCPTYEHGLPWPLFLLEASVCAVTGQGLREMMVPLLSNGQGLSKSPRPFLYIPG